MRSVSLCWLVALLAIVGSQSLCAQTFTQRLTKSIPGQGTVILVQDDEITRLLNGSVKQPTKPATPAKTAPSTTPTAPASSAPKAMVTMRGFRIQIYNGGDSREAKLAAQSAAARFKSQFPDIPVYTHYYAPHWTCRVGNFRTFEEANTCLRSIQQQSAFRAATIMKCTVQVPADK